MAVLKLIRNCNHIESTRTRSNKSKELTRGINTQYDIIDDDAVVRIFEVRDLLGAVISKINYKQYMHNKIEWLNNVLAPNSKYFMDYSVVNVITLKYPSSECPLCNGFGWYANFIDEQTNNIETISGKQKMAQEFLKLLLTEKGTNRLDINYGTKLASIISESLTASTINEVASNIIEAESYYRELQLQESNIPNSERLAKVNINSIELDEINSGIYVYLTLVSFSAEQVSLGFNLVG